MEMRQIETIFETVQNADQQSQFRDQETYRLEEAVDWRSGHWRNDSLLDQKLPTQFTLKVHVFSDSVLCLDNLEAATTWENDRIREFVQGPEYQPYYDITSTPVEFVWKTHEGKRRLFCSNASKP